MQGDDEGGQCHLLVLHGGDFLQEVRDCLALWDVESQALEVGDHLLTRPVKDQIACKHQLLSISYFLPSLKTHKLSPLRRTMVVPLWGTIRGLVAAHKKGRYKIGPFSALFGRHVWFVMPATQGCKFLTTQHSMVLLMPTFTDRTA